VIPEPVIIGVLTTLGAIAGAITAVYTTKRTLWQADKAQKHDDAIEADKMGLEGLRELAIQNRQDREEMRRDRQEMMLRVSALERRVAELETERARDRATIAELQADIEDRKRMRHNLLRYIRILREFIASLGAVPPEPPTPLPMD
jgi:chromosome segregation ATPase